MVRHHHNLFIFLSLLLLPSASAFLLNVNDITTSSGGNATSYFTNTSSDTIKLVMPYNRILFQAGESIYANTSLGGFFEPTAEGGFRWGINDGSASGFNEPYVYIGKQDIHATIDFFIPVLNCKTNFGNSLCGITPTLYVIGTSTTGFGSLLMTTSGFTSTGSDSRQFTLGATHASNISYVRSNFGDIELDAGADSQVFTDDDLTVNGDLHAGVTTLLQFGAKVLNGRSVPFGACGSYFWEEANLWQPYWQYDQKTWMGNQTNLTYGTTVPCNGTITRIAGGHETFDYNNTGNVESAFSNISIGLNGNYESYGSYYETGVGPQNFIIAANRNVVEGDKIQLRYVLTVEGAGTDPDNDYCINHINTVVNLVCQQ